MPIQSSRPVNASFSSDKLTIGAGVAIFQLATSRVVVCYHSRDKYWFLPKGRRNVNERTTCAAEREGFEESGYRNRVLPLPLKHRQTDSGEGHQRFVTEPLWTQFLPLTTTSQYLLFWYAAETVPPDVERVCTSAQSGTGASVTARVYTAPVGFPRDLTLRERIAMDTITCEDGVDKVHEPVWHEGTGVDEEELLYRSFLLPIDEARQKLKGSIMEDVVRRAWEAIGLRLDMESQ